MWMFIAIVLLTVGGSLGDDDRCLRRLVGSCGIFEYSEEQNVNDENLLSFCHEVQDFLQCLIEGAKECGQNTNRTDPLNSALSYLKEVCKPDPEMQEGSLRDDDICLSLQYRKCDVFENSDRRNVNAENLLSFCQEIQDLLHCLVEGAKECMQNANRIDRMENAVNYLKNVCKPDSNIYKAISNNFDCVKDNMFHMCKGNEELFKELQLVKTQSGRELSRECQTSVFLSVCKLETTTQCEEHVWRAVQEVFMNTYLALYCSEDVTDIVTDIKESMHIAQIIENIEVEVYN